MRHVGMRLAAVALGAWLVTGCFGGKRAPQIRYYTVAVGQGTTRLPLAVRVGAFGAAPPYRSTRIALRRSKFRLDYYDFNRWAANPQSLIAAAVQNYFDRIGTPHAPQPIIVTGRIDRLEAVQQGPDLRAVVAITFDAQGHDREALVRTYVERVDVDGHEPENVVAALSVALERVLGRFAADLAAAYAPPP
ncbi:MAG TPA: ABC-type transport auxiliary lipoprotein family protein [Candidatus Limnocylindria bacterium]|nr:ABC-type transport auxiliary lipoprotein family protein [Candidatus Limnocylindria bacterium]